MANNPLIAIISDSDEASFDGGEPIWNQWRVITMTSPEQNLQQVELKSNGMNWWFGLLPEATILKMDVNRVSGDELTLPENNSKSSENRPPQRELSSSNHCYAGRVGFISFFGTWIFCPEMWKNSKAQRKNYQKIAKTEVSCCLSGHLPIVRAFSLALHGCFLAVSERTDAIVEGAGSR